MFEPDVLFELGFDIDIPRVASPSSLSEEESHASSHSASRGMEKYDIELVRWMEGREDSVEVEGKREALRAICGLAEWGRVGGGTGVMARGLIPA